MREPNECRHGRQNCHCAICVLWELENVYFRKKAADAEAERDARVPISKAKESLEKTYWIRTKGTIGGGRQASVPRELVDAILADFGYGERGETGG